jgi:hypothetical protein
MFVTSPGFGKTFYGNQLIHKAHGLFSNVADPSGKILLKTGFEGYTTEAGWVGSLEPNPALAGWEARRAKGIAVGPKPKPIELHGLAHEYYNGIVSIDEFSAINAAIKQQHSANLDPALLSSLDSGRVRKRLKAGPLEYNTYLTAWFGTQPARFDLSSGLGRRMFFMTWTPNQEEQEQLIDAHWDGKNVATPIVNLRKFKEDFADTITLVEDIKSLHFEHNFQDYFTSLGRPHYELTLFERLAIGWYIMRGKFDKHLVIDIEEGKLTEMFLQAIQWRDRLMTESEGDQVLQVLKDHGNRMMESALKVELRKFGVTYTHAEDILIRLQRYGYLTRPMLQKAIRWVVLKPQ